MSHQPRHPASQKLTLPSLILSIVISFLGAGVLNLPASFSSCGVVLSSSSLTFVCAASVLAMLELIDVGEVVKREKAERGEGGGKETYCTLARYTLGGSFGSLVKYR